MSEFLHPRRHEESPPRKRMGATGRSVPGNGIVTFPASRPVLHDCTPDPDTDLPSDRIEPRPFGNGILESYRSKLPTPDDEFDSTLAASVLREAVMQMGATPAIADIFIEYTQRVIDERVEAKLRSGGAA